MKLENIITTLKKWTMLPTIVGTMYGCGNKIDLNQDKIKDIKPKTEVAKDYFKKEFYNNKNIRSEVFDDGFGKNITLYYKNGKIQYESTERGKYFFKSSSYDLNGNTILDLIRKFEDSQKIKSRYNGNKLENQIIETEHKKKRDDDEFKKNISFIELDNYGNIIAESEYDSTEGNGMSFVNIFEKSKGLEKSISKIYKNRLKDHEDLEIKNYSANSRERTFSSFYEGKLFSRDCKIINYKNIKNGSDAGNFISGIYKVDSNGDGKYDSFSKLTEADLNLP